MVGNTPSAMDGGVGATGTAGGAGGTTGGGGGFNVSARNVDIGHTNKNKKDKKAAMERELELHTKENEEPSKESESYDILGFFFVCVRIFFVYFTHFSFATYKQLSQFFCFVSLRVSVFFFRK